MGLQLMLSYKAVFKEMPNTIEELTKEIPSKVVLFYLSLLNSRVQRDNDDKVFDFVTRRWPEKNISFIKHAKGKYEFESKAKVVYVAEWVVTEYIKYEILNFRDFEYGHPNTTIEHEINLYLAYLLLVDEVLIREEIQYPKSNEFNFQEIIWPLGIFQFEFINYTHPFFDAIRIESFLWALHQDDKYNNFVTEYLKKYNVSTTWQLVSMYLRILVWIVEMKQSSNEFFYIRSNSGDIHHLLLEQNLISINEYQQNPDKQKYFIGLKEKPIYKYDDSVFLILNYKFFLNQIYNGLLFDFFFTSGIATSFGGRFDTFKSTLSYDISEKIIFRKAINIAFDNKRFKIVFPDMAGIVDAYVRDGKNVYLIEFKDASFGLSLVDTRNYTKFIENISRTFIQNEKGSPKGIKQLITSIKSLFERPFDFDRFDLKSIKTRNLIIYPIIIYTDSYYSIYGVNEFLGRKFVELSDFRENEHLVKPLTMISMDLFMRKGEDISKGNLKEIISGYHDWRKRIEKKMHKVPDPNESFKVYSSIEHSPQNNTRENNKKYTERVLQSYLGHLE